MTALREPVSAQPAAVRVAGGRFSDDVRAVRVVWKREIIRFGRSRIRILTSLVQPVLYLFVLGTGLARIVPTNGASAVDFRTFMFPGVLAMVVLFSAMFSAVSIVWDREFGFLREMLVAPVRRSALVIGKCLGGATVATFQGVLMIAIMGLVHVPYDPVLLLELLGVLALTAFAITAFGVMIASRMAQVESFQMVMQFAVIPMFFLSGALFPLSRLPGWLRLLTRLDPLSYSVAPMRHAVIAALPESGARLLRPLDPGVTWNGWRVPTYIEVLVIAAFALVSLGVAVLEFNRAD